MTCRARPVRQRAERGVPYAALLQAYRIGGRYIWELLVEAADHSVREQLLRAAADIWAVTDDLSAQVTEGYRTTLADRARRDVQVRSALLGTLLDGDVDVAEQLWESAAVLKLPRTAEFVVVTAECPSPRCRGAARDRGGPASQERHLGMARWIATTRKDSSR